MKSHLKLRQKNQKSRSAARYSRRGGGATFSRRLSPPPHTHSLSLCVCVSVSVCVCGHAEINVYKKKNGMKGRKGGGITQFSPYATHTHMLEG